MLMVMFWMMLMVMFLMMLMVMVMVLLLPAVMVQASSENAPGKTHSLNSPALYRVASFDPQFPIWVLPVEPA